MQDTSKPISRKEAFELWLKGSQILIVEYRNSVAETISWRDRETNKMLSAAILRHNVETDSGPLIINERMGEGFDPKSYASPFTKGKRYVCHFTEMATARGVTTGRGTLQTLID